jgi:hypothetical protein
MAAVSKTRTYSSGDILTADNYNDDRDEIIAGVNSIVNAQVASDAAIALSKLATGALPSGITIASANITDGAIVNADVNTSAAIAESKLAFDTTSGHDHDGSNSKLISVNRAFSWYVSGTLSTGTNFGARYVVPQDMTIVKCWLIVRTAPTGEEAAILIDINLNGLTIWSTQGNRATIAASATSGNTTTFDTTALTAGQYLDLDIDQVGLTVAGVDLTVILEASQP